MPGFVSPYATAVTVNRLRDLFHPPPPNRTCDFHRIRLSSSRKPMGFGHRHLAYLVPHVPVNLSPFAMCPAFPDSNYYRDSVTMGLGRVGGWRGSWIMPGFVSPYAAAVTVNRLQDLFHPPPPEPCLQLSKHTALQFPDSYRIQHVGITPTSSLMFR